MTRTESIAAAIAIELARHGANIEQWTELRSIVFDVKLKPGTMQVRAVIVRPEFERVTLETDARGIVQRVRERNLRLNRHRGSP